MLTINRILVPTDFSPGSLSALAYARSMAEQFKATLEILHVLWSPPPLVGVEVMMLQMPNEMGRLDNYIRQQAEAQMEKFLADLPAEWRGRLHRRFLSGEPSH